MFFVGLALSIVYYLTGNFLVPVGMHIIFNVIGSGAFSKLFGLSKQGETVLIYILYAAIPFDDLRVWTTVSIAREAAG